MDFEHQTSITEVQTTEWNRVENERQAEPEELTLPPKTKCRARKTLEQEGRARRRSRGCRKRKEEGETDRRGGTERDSWTLVEWWLEHIWEPGGCSVT